MAASCLPDRVSVSFVVALAAAVIACSPWNSARAFDFFGLWGSDESPPPVSRTAISYSVTVDVVGGDGALTNAVKDASSLYKLRKDPPPDGDALARRAQGDFGPIIDALWGAGYYDATVTISIDRASLTIQSSDIAGFARAADSYRNRAVAPVTIAVDPGPLFSLRSIRVLGPGGAEFSEAELPARIVGLKPGDSAAAADLRAAEARIVDYFRKQGRPLAKDRLDRSGRRSRRACDGRDLHRRSGSGRAVRRSDDERTEEFRPAHRALVPLYRARRSLFAARDRGRAEQHSRNPGGRRRAHHRRDGARRLRPPSLHGRRRGPPALRRRRVGEIFDHQRPGRSGLLGGPQCLRRRGAAAPAGRHLLCAALVRDLAGASETSRSTISEVASPRAS